MNPPQKWETLDSKFVVNHRWCQVRQDTVQLSDGKILDDYFIQVRPDIVLVFPVTQDKNVIFVRQYRHGVEKILLELPAGRCDSQEEPEIAARREFEEETGYSAPELIKLATLYDNPVKDTNRIHLFLAQNAYFVGEQQLDETENIEVVLIPLPEVENRILQGEICVSGTVAALFLGLKFMAEMDGRT